MEFESAAAGDDDEGGEWAGKMSERAWRTLTCNSPL